jgi:hypothetical protein
VQIKKSRKNNVLEAAKLAEQADQSIYNKSVLFWMALAGNLGGLACGYNTGVVAPAMLFMEEIFPEITPIGKAVSRRCLEFM